MQLNKERQGVEQKVYGEMNQCLELGGNSNQWKFGFCQFVARNILISLFSGLVLCKQELHNIWRTHCR